MASQIRFICDSCGAVETVRFKADPYPKGWESLKLHGEENINHFCSVKCMAGYLKNKVDSESMRGK